VPSPCLHAAYGRVEARRRCSVSGALQPRTVGCLFGVVGTARVRAWGLDGSGRSSAVFPTKRLKQAAVNLVCGAAVTVASSRAEGEAGGGQARWA
jgi:hypothetical protein